MRPPRPGTTSPPATISGTLPGRQADTVETLAIRASHGCRDALGDLYEATIDPLYRYLYANTRDHHVAEDLTSETWLAAVRAITTYQSRRGHGFTAWLFTIARNKRADYYRSRHGGKVPATIPLDMVDTVLHTDTDDTLPGGHLRDCVVTAVNALPARQRETIILNDLIGLTLTETAGVLGRKEPAVRKAHSRAITALRATLVACQTGPDHA